MALSDPIPVRFSSTADMELGLFSASSGLSKAELIRIAVDDFLRKTEQTGEIVQRHFVGKQNVIGKNNVVNQGNIFSPAPDAPAPGQVVKPQGKRGKKKSEK